MPKGLVTKTAGKHFTQMVEYAISKRKTNEEVFVENSTYARHNIKARLIKQNLIEYSCVCCNNKGEHNGYPLVLQLDHINGVNNDHRLENLRFLCPNCHTQQETYAAKNRIAKRKYYDQT